MNDTTNASPVSDAFGDHPLVAKSEANLPPETKAAMEKKAPAKKAKVPVKKVHKAKPVPKAKPAPKAKAKAKPAPKAKAAPKAKPAPKAKAKPAKAKAAPKAPKSLVRRVGGDNKILFTFRIADTMLGEINALATKHSMTPAALIRGALNAFLEQNGLKRGRAK